MRKVAIFVDAGYFWVQVVNVIHGRVTPGRIFGRDSVAINYEELRASLLELVAMEFPATDLLRVYWYDGPGHQGKADSHLSVEELDDFKLRLGTRNGVGNQKAVDGLIITDMISLAQSRSITSALLVSGDADLAPGVVAAQGLGIRVHLLSMGSTAATSHYLKAEADRKHHWQDAAVERFASAVPVHTVQMVQQPSAYVRPSVPRRIASPSEPAISSEAMAEIVSKVFMQLAPEEAEQLSGRGSIPKEIDRTLLRVGRETLGKPQLSDQERHLIRAKCKTHRAPNLISGEVAEPVAGSTPKVVAANAKQE